MNVFDYALQVEKEAMEFYVGLAQKVTGKGPQRIYSELASYHKERWRFIENMQAVASPSTALNNEDLARDTSPWHQPLPEAALAGEFDDEEAYRLALKLEEEGILCFEKVLARTGDRADKSVLKQITEEENRHLGHLRELYDFINAPNQFLASGEFSNLDEFHQFGRDVD